MRREDEHFFNCLKSYLESLDGIYMSGHSSIQSLSGDHYDRWLEGSEDLEGGHASNQIENAEKKFFDTMDSLDKTEFLLGVIPYSDISEIIFNKADTELLGNLEEFIENHWEKYEHDKQEVNHELHRKFLKIKEHIGLSVRQNSHISDRLSMQLDDVNKKHNELAKQNKKMEESVNNYKENINRLQSEFQQKYDGMITQFIAILGIFAAILMGAFGSIRGFTSIFDNAQGMELGRLLIISGIICSFIVVIIFLLMNSIAKLTGYNLSSCKCHKETKGTPSVFKSITRSITGDEHQCNCPFFEKHPSIALIHYLLLLVVVSGFGLMLINRNETIYNFTNNAFFTGITIVLVIYLSVRALIYTHKKYIAETDPEFTFADLLFTEPVRKTFNKS